MRKSILLLVATMPFTWACAGFPAPTQRLADAESAMRSAREVGADSQPVARLEVKLAEEQIARARILMTNGDNKRADLVLVRARADAELALALARERNADVEMQKAVVQSGATLTANMQGAQP